MLATLIGAVMAAHHAPAFSLGALRGLMGRDPDQAEQMIRGRFKQPELDAGISPFKDELTVLFAIDPGAGQHEAVVTGSNLKSVTLRHVGGLLAQIVKLKEGQGTTVQYSIDGRQATKTYNLEVYHRNPDVEPPVGGRKGELRNMGAWTSQIFPNTTRQWYIYLPPNFDASHEYPVLIGTDAQWDREWQANALENCARGGKIPPTVGIFIEPGQDKPGNYSFRSHEYDRLSPDYSSFLLNEIFPEVQKIVKLSSDPSQRACVGISSGGICGFTNCWQHPEAFSAVISGVGSFDDIAHGESLMEGGHNYPFMIRLSDKKQIRVFLQDGENDLDNAFGNWFISASQMAAALKFKGYDVQWRPGQGFHSSDHLRSIFSEALVWWNGKKM